MSSSSRSVYRLFLFVLNLVGGFILIANAYAPELQKTMLSMTMELCGISLIASVIALLLNRLTFTYLAQWATIVGAFLSIFTAIAYTHPKNATETILAGYLPFALMVFQITIAIGTRQFIREDAKPAPE